MSGTAKHTMQQLQDALLADKTEMNISGGSSGLTVYLDSDHEHLGAALRLMAEILKELSFRSRTLSRPRPVCCSVSSRRRPIQVPLPALRYAEPFAVSERARELCPDHR